MELGQGPISLMQFEWGSQCGYICLFITELAFIFRGRLVHAFCYLMELLLEL